MQAKTEVKINDVTKEFIKSEEHYNDSLELLQDALKAYNGSLWLLDVEDSLLTNLQSEVTNLKKISNQLLKNINPETQKSSTNIEWKECREERVRLVSSFYESYEYYKLLFKQYEQQLKINRAPFDTIDQWLKIHELKAGNLDSLLRLPIQRGMRYKLLITEGTKNTIQFEKQNKEAFNVLEQSLVRTNSTGAQKSGGFKLGDGLRYLFNWPRKEESSKKVKKAIVQVEDDEFMNTLKLKILK